MYLEADLQQFFLTHRHAKKPTLLEPQKAQLKFRLPKLYHGESYIKCYHFYQQCIDHFNKIKSKKINRILFIASFLQVAISF